MKNAIQFVSVLFLFIIPIISQAQIIDTEKDYYIELRIKPNYFLAYCSEGGESKTCLKRQVTSSRRIKWNFVGKGNGYYLIVTKESPAAITLLDEEEKSGIAFDLEETAPEGYTEIQQFKIEENSDGTFYIMPRATIHKKMKMAWENGNRVGNYITLDKHTRWRIIDADNYTPIEEEYISNIPNRPATPSVPSTPNVSDIPSRPAIPSRGTPPRRSVTVKSNSITPQKILDENCLYANRQTTEDMEIFYNNFRNNYQMDAITSKVIKCGQCRKLKSLAEKIGKNKFTQALKTENDIPAFEKLYTCEIVTIQEVEDFKKEVTPKLMGYEVKVKIKALKPIKTDDGASSNRIEPVGFLQALVMGPDTRLISHGQFLSDSHTTMDLREKYLWYSTEEDPHTLGSRRNSSIDMQEHLSQKIFTFFIRAHNVNRERVTLYANIIELDDSLLNVNAGKNNDLIANTNRSFGMRELLRAQEAGNTEHTFRIDNNDGIILEFIVDIQVEKKYDK